MATVTIHSTILATSFVSGGGIICAPVSYVAMTT